MIHVEPRPEPVDFDAKVRQPGLYHLAKGGKTTDSNKDFWVRCLDDLYFSYGGVCAYLSVHFERVTGAASTDHYLPKSDPAVDPLKAYEWSNYRLACRAINSKKHVWRDVLDPFEVEDGWFRLELVSGCIFAAPATGGAIRARVERTIDRLGLDSPNHRKMRTDWYDEYRNGNISEDYLRRKSPFVWLEIKRQGLL